MTARQSHPSVPALVRGSLVSRPCAKLLLQLFRRSLTGRVAIVDDGAGRSTVFFRNGIPIFVERPDNEDRLDRVLLDQGKLEPEMVAEAERKRAETGQRLGDVLKELGFLDHPSLASVLRLQTSRKLARIVRLERGVFEVFVHEHGFGLGEEFDELMVQPVRVVYAAIREGFTGDRLIREAQPLEHQVMTLKPKLPFSLSELGFLFSQQPILEGLRSGGIGFDELRDAELLSQEILAGLLVFHYADMLELKPVSRVQATSAMEDLSEAAHEEPTAEQPVERIMHADPPDEEQGAPSRQSGSSPFTRRMAPVKEELVHLPGRPGSQPTSRNVAMGASSEKAERRTTGSSPAVKTTTGSHPAVKTTTGSHPAVSRTPPQGAQPHAPANDASQEWSVPTPTSGFGAIPKTGSGFDTPTPSRATGIYPSMATRTQLAPPGAPIPSDPGRRKSEAYVNFKRGETLLKHGDFARAEPHFQRALELMPDDREYQALLFWVRFMNPKTEDRNKAAQDGLVGIAAILKMQPEFARARYFAAMMLKHLGEMDRAERAFAAALKSDPTLVDAERELRLIAIRRPPAKANTIFGIKVK